MLVYQIYIEYLGTNFVGWQKQKNGPSIQETLEKVSKNSQVRKEIVFEGGCPILGEKRKIVVCRELTKKFETIYRGTALQVKESLKNDVLKGELVLLISPRIEEVVGKNEIDMSLKKLMKSHSLKESVKIVSENLGVNKNIVYKSALKINGS